MNLLKTVVSAGIVLSGIAGAVQADMITDVVQWNTEINPNYFVDDAANTYNTEYYRWFNQDWGWSHSAVDATFSSATLSISAWDVDASSGEVDEIFVKDEGSFVKIGNLAGGNNAYSYTTFTLGSNFYNEIASGLEVYMNIDATHNYKIWAVTLAKSVLSLDGAVIPDPNPDPDPDPVSVPEPSSVSFLSLIHI